MKKHELIEMLEKYPDDYEIVLIDLTTDDEEDCVYGVDEEDIEEISVTDQNGDIMAIGIAFFNKLNPNPILPFDDEDIGGLN